MAKKIRRLQKNVKQKDGSFITEHYETDATIVEYDSTNSGLECANTQEAIDELAKQQKVIEGNIISETTYESKELTIPIEGWTDAAIGQYAKKVSVPVTDLKITDIIEGEVTLDTEEFAQECKLAYQCECTENSVTFFSATLPTSPIKINYYILQGKDGNTSLGKIVYTSSEVVDGFESNSVTKSGSANNDMILNQQVNNNKEDIADLVKQLTEINGKLSALGTTDTDLQTQISELNKNIEGNMANVNTGLITINNNLNTANTNINNVKSTVDTVNTNVSGILNKINAGTSVIKSIQRGTVDIPYKSTNVTANINNVNVNKTIVLFDSVCNYNYLSDLYGDYRAFRYELSSTTVRFFRRNYYDQNGNASTTVSYTIIEFI